MVIILFAAIKEIVGKKSSYSVSQEYRYERAKAYSLNTVLATSKIKKDFVFDESMSAMDKESREVIEQFLQNESGKTIIQISHVMNQEEQEK